MLNADEPLGAVLWRLLYVSDIVDQDLAVVVAICSQSRPWNADVGITGLLVFDGARFLQYIEGPPASIEELYGRLRRDRRHHNMTVLTYGRCGPDRAFPSWQLAFASGGEDLGLVQLRAEQGEAAVDAFFRLSDALNLEDLR